MPTSTAHILVVDDNPATLYSTTRVLRSAGWTVSEAETGEQALNKVRSGVDLVVLDVNLPDIDGFDVCRRIRENKATARLPVLHLSATFVQDAHKVHGLEAGADGYLTHPIEPPVLIATVNAFLRARQAEIELRESETRFKAIFESAPNGVALVSDELAFVVVNPAICQFLAMTREEIVGRSLQEFLEGENSTAVAEIRAQIATCGSWKGTLNLKRSDGNVINSDWNLSTHSSPGIWLAIVTDITDRLKYERDRERLLAGEHAARKEAERANRYKDDFIATMSHELRTPLNAILGWSQIVGLGKLSEAEAKTAIATIERNARIQADMIADLLDVSRITSGKIDLELQTVNPADVIDAAVTALLPTAKEKSINIASDIDRAAGPISADPARLQQVIWNLLVNAVKFTPDGGAVQVVLRRASTSVEITVCDNGVGLSAELLPQIFDRFRQGDSSTTRQHAGLGLGLAIVKQLVEMHGGSVSAQSGGEGKGATFTVRLPYAGGQPIQPSERSAPDAVVSSPAREQTRVDLKGIRVLVVEDDADARRLLSRIVSDSAGDSHAVSSVQDALEVIGDYKPNFLISDLGMPRQDGFDLIGLLRARGYTHRDLPAIALSAFADSKSRQQALLAGFQGHLAKPVEASELVAVIAALMGRTG